MSALASSTLTHFVLVGRDRRQRVSLALARSRRQQRVGRERRGQREGEGGVKNEETAHHSELYCPSICPRFLVVSIALEGSYYAYTLYYVRMCANAADDAFTRTPTPHAANDSIIRAKAEQSRAEQSRPPQADSN